MIDHIQQQEEQLTVNSFLEELPKHMHGECMHGYVEVVQGSVGYEWRRLGFALSGMKMAIVEAGFFVHFVWVFAAITTLLLIASLIWG